MYSNRSYLWIDVFFAFVVVVSLIRMKNEDRQRMRGKDEFEKKKKCTNCFSMLKFCSFFSIFEIVLSFSNLHLFICLYVSTLFYCSILSICRIDLLIGFKF